MLTGERATSVDMQQTISELQRHSRWASRGWKNKDSFVLWKASTMTLLAQAFGDKSEHLEQIRNIVLNEFSDDAFDTVMQNGATAIAKATLGMAVTELQRNQQNARAIRVPSDVRSRALAELAIREARKSVSEDGRVHPKVGVVVVKDGVILATAHRGEIPGCHAEYIALEKKLPNDALTGATVYTTLEPCTARNHPKIPCAQRLVERHVAHVVIGMLDPDDRISGRGQRALRKARIVTEFFPHDLMEELEELNRDFVREREAGEHAVPGDDRDQLEIQITNPKRNWALDWDK